MGQAGCPIPRRGGDVGKPGFPTPLAEGLCSRPNENGGMGEPGSPIFTLEAWLQARGGHVNMKPVPATAVVALQLEIGYAIDIIKI